MKRIFVCSRYRAVSRKLTVADNLRRARELGRDVLARGHAPYIPHLYLPRLLSDAKPGERQKGLDAALALMAGCDEVWVDCAFGLGAGMMGEIRAAVDLGKPVCAPWHPPRGCLELSDGGCLVVNELVYARLGLAAEHPRKRLGRKLSRRPPRDDTRWVA